MTAVVVADADQGAGQWVLDEDHVEDAAGVVGEGAVAGAAVDAVVDDVVAVVAGAVVEGAFVDVADNQQNTLVVGSGEERHQVVPYCSFGEVAASVAAWD